jgi:hypothetical protein
LGALDRHVWFGWQRWIDMSGLAGSAGSTCLVLLSALDRHVLFGWALWIDLFGLVWRAGLEMLL